MTECIDPRSRLCRSYCPLSIIGQWCAVEYAVNNSPNLSQALRLIRAYEGYSEPYADWWAEVANHTTNHK